MVRKSEFSLRSQIIVGQSNRRFAEPMGAVHRRAGGRRVSGIIYTLVENCRRLVVNPRDYLEDVLTRLPRMKASEAASLTPANWLKARGCKKTRLPA